jgi:hypothetical protein
MALPTLDATFASVADLPRKYMLARWLVGELGSGSIADYVTLPERYLWAKIAVAAGAPKDEAAYIGLPKQHAWKDIYNAVAGSSLGTIDWSEKQALGHIAAAYRGDTGNPANLATYINWPWRYQVASIIGGGTVTFSPNDISGLQLWLDGSDTSTMYDAISGGSLVAIDGAIARWEDKSVNNNHAIQSVSNNRPLRKASQLNSLNGVEFDGENDILEGSEVLTDYPYSVFSVCKFTSDTDIGLIFGQRNIEYLPTIYKYGENGIRLYSGQNLEASDVVNNNSWYSLRFIGNEENSEIYINNVLAVSGNAGSGSLRGNYLLGSQPDYFGGTWQGIVYAELLVYNKILSSEETSEIESYINTKWDI